MGPYHLVQAELELDGLELPHGKTRACVVRGVPEPSMTNNPDGSFLFLALRFLSSLLTGADHLDMQDTTHDRAVKPPRWITLWVESKGYLGKFKLPSVSRRGRDDSKRQEKALLVFRVMLQWEKACKLKRFGS